MDVTGLSAGGHTNLPMDTPAGNRTLNLHAQEPIEEENKDNGEESEQESNEAGLNGAATHDLGPHNTELAPEQIPADRE
jgi:hypothetical protein